MPSTPLLKISVVDVVPRILEIGMKQLPKEACGLVIPELDLPSSEWVIEFVNRSTSPTDSYEIDPMTVAHLLVDAAHAHTWDDVLIWHTHPSGAVGPSKRDMETRNKALKYLVVSLPRGEAVLY